MRFFSKNDSSVIFFVSREISCCRPAFLLLLLQKSPLAVFAAASSRSFSSESRSGREPPML